MGVLQCKRLNYSLQMGQIWLIMTQDDWLWPRMTYQGSWGHQGVQGGARGHQGAPGGSWLPLAPKRVIKQQNNDPKPWFKVPKVCPDPKGVVFTQILLFVSFYSLAQLYKGMKPKLVRPKAKSASAPTSALQVLPLVVDFNCMQLQIACHCSTIINVL